ncbi:Fpg/Nei family DNA glycosylase [Sanguibacter sp. A247]|uniref:Fpg/Nei family DNA glycosylase n=1 Tax=unclassified Sanguibacter TaxID=2645534 RepID=UPI003FD869B7
MPEGHTVHRLARTFDALFSGQALRVSSPQGRFAAGAERLDGLTLVRSEAWGKHMFAGFARVAPATADARARVPMDELTWLRVHLGLYGSWTFAGDSSTSVVHAIGAPRRRVGEREHALPALATPVPISTVARADAPDGDGFVPPAPRGQVRVRVLGDHAVADLTGPSACEVLDADGVAAVLRRLGPDPLRPDADPERWVDRVVRSRSEVGLLLMDQSVVAGVGNIYRAEVLFRAGLNPATRGSAVPREMLRAIWDDLVVLMNDGVATGRIVTTRPEHRGLGHELGRMDPRRVRQNTDDDPGVVPREESFYVYHREGLACRVCGAVVLVRDAAGRTLFWCPSCQA